MKNVKITFVKGGNNKNSDIREKPVNRNSEHPPQQQPVPVEVYYHPQPHLKNEHDDIYKENHQFSESTNLAVIIFLFIIFTCCCCGPCIYYLYHDPDAKSHLRQIARDAKHKALSKVGLTCKHKYGELSSVVPSDLSEDDYPPPEIHKARKHKIRETPKKKCHRSQRDRNFTGDKVPVTIFASPSVDICITTDIEDSDNKDSCCGSRDEKIDFIYHPTDPSTSFCTGYEKHKPFRQKDYSRSVYQNPNTTATSMDCGISDNIPSRYDPASLRIHKTHQSLRQPISENDAHSHRSHQHRLGTVNRAPGLKKEYIYMAKARGIDQKKSKKHILYNMMIKEWKRNPKRASRHRLSMLAEVERLLTNDPPIKKNPKSPR